MFSTGQYIFVGLFILAFVILIIRSYKKDAKLHRKEYKGSKWILLGFIGFIILLFVIKMVLKK